MFASGSLLLGGPTKQIMLMVFWYISFLTSRALSMVELTATSAVEDDGRGGCVQLLTCTAGPIQGNLFWYATFGSGLEIRLARNDGGNAETNPPYNEITLEGVTNFHTRVSRRIINDSLFVDFNSTLAFDVLNSLQFNLTSISCGSLSTNSSIIVPIILQFNDLNYDISQTVNSSGYVYECSGINVPLTLRIGNCSINNTNSMLRWIVNDSLAVQYGFKGNNLEETLGSGSGFYTRSLQRVGDKLNFTSGLTLNSTTQCISLRCGSNLFSSKEVFHAPGTPNVMISVLYEDLVTEVKAEWNALVPPCFEITYVYEAVLKNATGAVVQTMLKKCSTQICDVLFQVSQVYGVFIVEVKAYIDGQDTEAGTFISDLIDATRMEQLNVTFSHCLTSITCNADLLGTCVITFNDGNNFNVTVHGQINESISLPKFERNVNYFYTAIFNDIFIFRGGFIGVQNSTRLSRTNTALIIIGVLICVLSIFLLVIETAVVYKRRMLILNKKIVILIITTVVLLIIVSTDVILWIIIASVVSPEEDTCDEVWLKNRDGLVIAAFVFAVISMFPSIQFLLVFKFYEIENIGKKGSEMRTQQDLFMEMHGFEGISDVKVDERGITTREHMVAAGHHRIGESTAHATLRIREEISKAIKEMKIEEERLRQIDCPTNDDLDRSMRTN